MADGEPIGLLLALTKATAAPPPVVEADAGGVWVAGYFSRGKWHAIKKTLKAEREALREAERKAKSKKAAQAVARAKEALDLAENVDVVPDKLDELRQRLEAATRPLLPAERVIAYQKIDQAARKLKEDLEDEQEVMLLLEHVLH